MRRNIDPVEDAYLRSEAERTRASNPFYRLSFFTCDDHTDAVFTPPRLPPGLSRVQRHTAGIAAGERMGEELLAAMADALQTGCANVLVGGYVLRQVFERCRDASVLLGFGHVMTLAMIDSADLFEPAQWRERFEWARRRRVVRNEQQAAQSAPRWAA